MVAFLVFSFLAGRSSREEADVPFGRNIFSLVPARAAVPDRLSFSTPFKSFFFLSPRPFQARPLGTAPPRWFQNFPFLSFHPGKGFPPPTGGWLLLPSPSLAIPFIYSHCPFLTLSGLVTGKISWPLTISPTFLEAPFLASRLLMLFFPYLERIPPLGRNCKVLGPLGFFPPVFFPSVERSTSSRCETIRCRGGTRARRGPVLFRPFSPGDWWGRRHILPFKLHASLVARLLFFMFPKNRRI